MNALSLAGVGALLAWASRFRILLWAFALAGVLFAVPLARSALVPLGFQKAVAIPDIAKIAIADPNVVDVTPIGRSQIVIVGLRTGATTLLVWTRSERRFTYLVIVK
jgi:Flp pilus assembly secretin CpaC